MRISKGSIELRAGVNLSGGIVVGVIHVEKYNNSLLGIKSFQKYRNEISAFPPVLE